MVQLFGHLGLRKVTSSAIDLAPFIFYALETLDRVDLILRQEFHKFEAFINKTITKHRCIILVLSNPCHLLV